MPGLMVTGSLKLLILGFLVPCYPLQKTTFDKIRMWKSNFLPNGWLLRVRMKVSTQKNLMW